MVRKTKAPSPKTRGRASPKKSPPRKQAAPKSRASRKPAPPPKPAPRKRDYKTEYRARVKGTKPGTKERQAKRGHKPQAGKTEYQIRKARQEAALIAFADHQAWLGSGQGDYSARSGEEIADSLRDFVKDKGYSQFVALKRALADLNAQRAKKPHGTGIGFDLNQLIDQFELDDYGFETTELFYGTAQPT